MKVDKEALIHETSHGSNHSNKNPIINEINLTPQDEDDIIEFLKTLTDYEFIHNSQFRKDN